MEKERGRELGRGAAGEGPRKGDSGAQGSLHSTTLRTCLAEGGGMSPPEQDNQGKGRS